MALTISFVLLAAFSVSVLANWIVSRAQLRAKERQHGCLSIPRYRHVLPWGYDLYLRRMNATKEGRLEKLERKLRRQYGTTWEEITFGARTINTIETENLQTVGADKWDHYIKKRNDVLERFYGLGIFRQNGAEWKRSRDLVKPLFLRAELDDARYFAEFVDRMIARIPKDGSTFDLQPLLKSLFLDSSTYFIFGRSIGALSDDPRQAAEFAVAYDAAMVEANLRANVALGNLRLYFQTRDKAWERNYSKVHAWIDAQIARVRAEEKIPGDDQRRRYVLIYAMAKQIDDDVTLRFQLFNVFLSARIATSAALSHTFFYLARFPPVWADLRRQAVAIQEPLTFEVLKSLPMFKYAIFEGIRLQGPAGRLTREANQDTVLPRGGGPDGSAPVFVPKGTLVAMNTLTKNHDPSLWGDDVEDFRPSRFVGRSFANWDFTPFFGGPRTCPAQQQVLSQGIYLLIRMMQQFERLENRDDCLEALHCGGMIRESRNGVKVAVYP